MTMELSDGATTEELSEIRELKAKVRRLEEANDILRRTTVFFPVELDPEAVVSTATEN